MLIATANVFAFGLLSECRRVACMRACVRVCLRTETSLLMNYSSV